MSDRIEMQLKVLMLAGLAGDADAHSQLLSAAASRLRNYFGRRIGQDAADLEDLVQDTLIAIHQRRDSYNLALPFTAWLHAIAKYKLIDHYRRAGVRRHVGLDNILDLAGEDIVDPTLAAIDVDSLIAGLPEKHQAAIRLTRIEGYSIAEASSITGQSPSAIKIGVHRGLKKLMGKVGANDDRD